jgi:F0F1-type ATP synthase membrane subunit b/b'
VLLFILVRFGRRPMSEALARRKRGIMSEIDKAQGIKKSAEKRRGRYKDELEHLDDRLVALRDQYLLEGEHEERRVREEAAKTRERLLADAEFRISQEHKTARDELSRRALEDALRAAEEMLERAVTSADHDRLEAEYLDPCSSAPKRSPRSSRSRSRIYEEDQGRARRHPRDGHRPHRRRRHRARLRPRGCDGRRARRVPGGLMGLVLNLEQDNVGVALFGDRPRSRRATPSSARAASWTCPSARRSSAAS